MTNDTSPAQTTSRPLSDDEISLWEVMAVLLRRRWTIVWTTFVVGVISVGTGYLHTYYSTFGTFRPQGSQASASELLSLANQFGVSIPGGGGGEEATPAFYAELLKSRAILETVADETYEVEGVGRTNLVELLEIFFF